MSMGGHSLHKKDWITLAALTAAAAATGGAAGVGPLAGMMGGAAGAGAGAAGAAGLGAAEGAGLLGASGAAEMASLGAATPGIGSLIGPSMLGGGAELASVGATYNPMMMELGQSPMGMKSTGIAGMLDKLTPSNVGKGMKVAQASGLLGNTQQQQPMAAPHPYGGPPAQNTVLYPQQQGTQMSDEDMKKLLMALAMKQGQSGQWTV
jgi:hypothetical protein